MKPTDPVSILKRHIDLNPIMTIVASAYAGEKIEFEVSAPANVVDLVFLHKLLGMRIDAILSRTMTEAQKEEVK